MLVNLYFFPFSCFFIMRNELQGNILHFLSAGVTEPLGGDCGLSPSSPSGVCGIPASPSLSRVVLTLESSAPRQAALQHILNALQVMFARDCVIAALDTSASALPQAKEDFQSMCYRSLSVINGCVCCGVGQTCFFI